MWWKTQSNYRIPSKPIDLRLGFSKLQGKLVVKYVFTYTKDTLKLRSVKDLSNDAYAML